MINILKLKEKFTMIEYILIVKMIKYQKIVNVEHV